MSRFASLATALGLAFTACATESEALCLGGGDVNMVITPSLFSYGPLEDGAAVPVYVPAQGSTFTELDIEITGVAEDDLGALTVIVRLAGGDVIANPPASMSFARECQGDGSILLDKFPLQLDGTDFSLTPAELNGKEAAMVFQMQLKGGAAPITAEFDVVFDERTLN